MWLLIAPLEPESARRFGQVQMTNLNLDCSVESVYTMYTV